MICIECGARYAPFTKEDFFDHKRIWPRPIPRHENSEINRNKLYYSDDSDTCNSCKEKINYEC